MARMKVLSGLLAVIAAGMLIPFGDAGAVPETQQEEEVESEPIIRFFRYEGYIEADARVLTDGPEFQMGGMSTEGVRFPVDDNVDFIVFEMTWGAIPFTPVRQSLSLVVDHPDGESVISGTQHGTASNPLRMVLQDPHEGTWQAVARAQTLAVDQDYRIYVTLIEGEMPADYTVFDRL